MRFVRVFLSRETGEPVGVMEHEHPFVGADMTYTGMEVDRVDLGLVHDFDPTTLEGEPCDHARHIRLRLEKHPLAGTHPDAPRVRFAEAHQAAHPVFFCPCGYGDLEAHIRANGPERISTTARAWLCCILPEEEIRRMGIKLGVTRAIELAHLRNLESMRRLVPGNGRVQFFERLAKGA